MEFIAKSSWNERCIQDKLNRGADGIEIQLLKPEKEPALSCFYTVPEHFRGYGIRCIHTPLDAEAEFNYDIDTPRGKEWLIQTVLLASKMSQINGKPTNVICHMEHNIKHLRELSVYKSTIEFVRTLARNYPDVTICVENTTHRLTGIYDNVTFVNEVGMKNVGTCLDTCHALISEHYTGLITDKGAHPAGDYNFESLISAFRKNKDVCKWIHLAGAKDTGEGFGFGKGHGCVFDDDGDLRYILSLHENFTPGATICFEVREDDYLNCINFSRMLEMSRRILSEKQPDTIGYME